MSSNFGIPALTRVFNESSTDVRNRVIGIYALLVAFNILVWVIALIAFARYPLLLGTALLAYTFGLRHSVDADHISAIDNVTRKLMQENKRPVAVGFFFSLGHSTIVVALSIGIAIAATVIKNDIPGLQNVGGLIGTSVSAIFLFVIAIINLLVLWEIFQIVGNSWNMYPIGVLFGLGFDTATEVGLLGIAAVEAGKGLPIPYILIFPALFTAGMCLLDTTDGILMLGAYGWAFVKPVRKLYYNMNITLVSVVVALFVGGVEVLSIVSSELNLSGGLWGQVGHLSNNFGTLGFIIIGIFLVSWAISTLIYKVKKYDDIEVKVASKGGVGNKLVSGGGQ